MPVLESTSLTPSIESMNPCGLKYHNEGAIDLTTENEAAYDCYRIRPRVLRDLTGLDASTTIFGTKVTFPFGFSPSAMQALAHLDGEVGTSKAAAAVGVPMGLSNYSTVALEDVISHAKGNPYAMQISMLKNKEANIRLIRRTEKAGFKALLVTLDAPYLGRRLKEFRNSFGVPRVMEYPNPFPDVDVTDLEDADESMAYDSSIEWPELMPFFLYTIQDPELTIKYGLDGIIISNHGGRQLDTAPATIDVLREISPVAKGRIAIAVDGGIRRGTDIFKALPPSVDFCFAGRPAIWGLAYNGANGAELALKLLYDDFKTTLAMSGCRNVQELSNQSLSLL
ncbi:hypothetical protein BKA56DRAFT_634696 [Ilyonectria sp. MPI-CAGE-AT-0026]|nr:hypothetical protein BKA56DRAFT_634696 [Ilyonectria sp. MPI-CAGE-AT-0026]